MVQQQRSRVRYDSFPAMAAAVLGDRIVADEAAAADTTRRLDGRDGTQSVSHQTKESAVLQYVSFVTLRVDFKLRCFEMVRTNAEPCDSLKQCAACAGSLPMTTTRAESCGACEAAALTRAAGWGAAAPVHTLAHTFHDRHAHVCADGSPSTSAWSTACSTISRAWPASAPARAPRGAPSVSPPS